MDRMRFEAFLQARERKQSQQKYRSDFISRMRGIDQPSQAKTDAVTPFDYQSLYKRFCRILKKIEDAI
jgi:cellobiose phosphorylase